MSVIKIINNNLEEIINSDKKVLIDFYADWCGPCRELSPVIDEIAAEQNEFLVVRLHALFHATCKLSKDFLHTC